MTLFDPWTGKPVDRLSDFLPSSAGYQCDDCGAEVINRCGRCGAPQCCPRCCFEASQEDVPLAKDEERMESMSGFEFARKAGESDEDWAAACRDMARALAKATGTEHLLPNASIQVSEEMIEAGFRVLGAEPEIDADDLRAIYLAMKAKESLPQGDERSVDVELREAENVLRAHQHYDLAQTVSEARAALVRSKPIDRDIERLGEALFNLSDKMRASGILSASDAVHEAYERVVAEFTAIGSQSIEGERVK